MTTAYVLQAYAHLRLPNILSRLGWYPISVPDIFSSLLLTSILFAGPLFERGIAEGGWRTWIQGKNLYETLSSWIGWRNFVAVSFCIISFVNLDLRCRSQLVGDSYRGGPLSIGDPPHLSPDASGLLTYNASSCRPSDLRSRSHPSLLRVHLDSSAYPTSPCLDTYDGSIRFYHSLWLVRELHLSPDRQYLCCDSLPRLL